jgi:lipopolysaccharide/colanic/teichoic acid biosynthesis glycosyltransferase
MAIHPAPEMGARPAEAYADMQAAYGHRTVDYALRSLDVVIAGGVLLVSAPLTLLIALAIRLASGSPILYRGERVGHGGRIFIMCKFRTLAADAESRLGPYLGEELSELTELETTSVGQALRAVHVDELPQLWNVVRGDMSMVGPRPIRPAFFVELTTEVPQYWQRLVVRPGVTGFAQTRVRREETWSDKLAHDLEYIADRSVGLYLQVLAATVVQITRRTWEGLTRSPRRPPPL